MAIKKIRCFYLALLFGFFLGVHEGYIGLWDSGGTKPLRVFPYRAELLPQADQLALAERIYLADEAELQRLLEDYLS